MNKLVKILIILSIFLSLLCGILSSFLLYERAVEKEKQEEIRIERHMEFLKAQSERIEKIQSKIKILENAIDRGSLSESTEKYYKNLIIEHKKNIEKLQAIPSPLEP